MIRAIAARELRSLFLSPLAWVVLAVVEFILAYLFLSQLDQYAKLAPQLARLATPPGVTAVVVVPLFGAAAFVLMLVVPLLTMRLISEERRSRTLPLLFSAPVSLSEIVLGKYLGVLAFLAVMVALIALMPLSLLAAGSLDLGLFAAALSGLLLLVAAFAAVGLLLSTLSAQPTVAAVGSFGLLLVLWVIDWAGAADGGLFSYLSLQSHFAALLRGVFDSSDLAYFGLLIIGCIVLSIQRLDADRLQG